MNINQNTKEAPKIDAVLAENNISGNHWAGSTDKQTTHSYGPIYEIILKPFIDDQRQTYSFCEIGVSAGGSALLWQKLCPTAHVLGIDATNNVDKSVLARLDPTRYTFIFDDAYAARTLIKAQEHSPNGFNLIIDDGPHSLESQIYFLRMYLALLRPGGICVIEDVQDPNWFNNLTRELPQHWPRQVIDRRHIKNRYDDLMLIAQRV